MNFAKNRTLFPKMPKLGTSSLKQCAFLNGKRVLFSSRKIYEAGPMWGCDIASLVAVVFLMATSLRSSQLVFEVYFMIQFIQEFGQHFWFYVT